MKIILAKRRTSVVIMVAAANEESVKNIYCLFLINIQIPRRITAIMSKNIKVKLIF